MGFYVHSASAPERIRGYKYSGADNSLLYKHVLGPFARWLTQLLPTWLAPNLVTLAGLVVVVSALALTVVQSPRFDSQLPAWVSLYVALAFFAYQTLDNMDGQQARRTGSSSALGLLFDHGVDALNCTLGTVAYATVFQLGVGWKLYALWAAALVAFALATWEHHHVGHLELPIINGPSDGQVIAVLCASLAAVWPGLWALPLSAVLPDAVAAAVAGAGAAHPLLARATLELLALPLHWGPLLFVLLGALPTAAINVRNVYRRAEHGTFAQNALTLFSFALFGGTVAAWWLASPTSVFERMPRVFLVGHGFLFCNMICKLLLAHVSGEDYKLLRSVLLPHLALAALALSGRADAWARAAGLGALVGGDSAERVEDALCWAVFVWSFGVWVHFVVLTIDDLTFILRIHTFRIGPRRHAHRRERLASGGHDDENAEEDKAVIAVIPTRQGVAAGAREKRAKAE